MWSDSLRDDIEEMFSELVVFGREPDERFGMRHFRAYNAAKAEERTPYVLPKAFEKRRAQNAAWLASLAPLPEWKRSRSNGLEG